MMGIKENVAILNNVITSNSNNENEKDKLEADRHYAPDFI
jgi:hypothetical protein